VNPTHEEKIRLVSMLADFVNATADFVTKEQDADLESFGRIQNILSQAATELRQCFLEINSVLAGSDIRSDIREKLEAQYRTSIRVLQFEDIVQQILEHSQKQKFALVEAMRVLHKATDELKYSAAEGEEFYELVLECKKELDELIATHGQLNPVKQTSLESGDVELF